MTQVRAEPWTTHRTKTPQGSWKLHRRQKHDFQQLYLYWYKNSEGPSRLQSRKSEAPQMLICQHLQTETWRGGGSDDIQKCPHLQRRM